MPTPYGAFVLKGKAHGNAMQFESGLVAPWHYAGNAFADALADKGAEVAQVNANVAGAIKL